MGLRVETEIFLGQRVSALTCDGMPVSAESLFVRLGLLVLEI